MGTEAIGEHHEGTYGGWDEHFIDDHGAVFEAALIGPATESGHTQGTDRCDLLLNQH